MFEAKKSIPAVASASLVLGGGCGDDGPSVRSVANDLCRGFERCEPDYFADEFDSRAACVAYYESYAEETLDYYEREYGEDCVEALLDYLDCYADAYRQTCDYESAYDRCEALYDLVSVRCD